MNKFELFTIIYYWLDNYYKDSKDDMIIDQLSDMNPFVWEEIGSADPAVYDKYCDFIGDRTINSDNSLEIAKGYVATITYADMNEAFENVDTARWLKGIDDYLSTDHKGS